MVLQAKKFKNTQFLNAAKGTSTKVRSKILFALQQVRQAFFPHFKYGNEQKKAAF
jgi:hypothetical protein